MGEDEMIWGSQNSVFPGKQCSDFLAENRKACLSIYFQSRTLVLTLQFTHLHSTAHQALTRDSGQGGPGPGEDASPVTVQPRPLQERSRLAGAVTPRARASGLEKPAAAYPILPGWGCDGPPPPGPAPSGTLVGWGLRGC